jgi:hypothetical protein
MSYYSGIHSKWPRNTTKIGAPVEVREKIMKTESSGELRAIRDQKVLKGHRYKRDETF